MKESAKPEAVRGYIKRKNKSFLINDLSDIIILCSDIRPYISRVITLLKSEFFFIGGFLIQLEITTKKVLSQKKEKLSADPTFFVVW